MGVSKKIQGFILWIEIWFSKDKFSLWKNQTLGRLKRFKYFMRNALY